MVKKNISENTKNKQSVKFSAAVTQKVIKLLREDGKMSAEKIAGTIGKSRNTVYNMAQGKARLSAEDYGKLVPNISKSVAKALAAITMDDVKEAAKKVEEHVKELSRKAGKEGVKLSKRGAKFVAKKIGGFLEAAGEFIKSL